MNRSIVAIALLAASALSSGCLTLYSKTEVLRGDEQRVPVRYESARAAEAFRRGMERHSAEQGNTSFWLPFVTLYERRKVLSPEAHFNAQVRCCDADQDGLITEEEAYVYWGEWFSFPRDMEWFGPPPGFGKRASAPSTAQKSD